MTKSHVRIMVAGDKYPTFGTVVNNPAVENYICLRDASTLKDVEHQVTPKSIKFEEPIYIFNSQVVGRVEVAKLEPKK